MPVRRIPPSRRAITGRLSGLKSIGPAHYESALERDYLITLEADPAVAAYEIQPLRLKYQDAEGRARTYTPDVLVFRRGGAVDLCEVKYVADIQQLRVMHRQRWIAAFQHARAQGWRFRLITEHDARTVRTRNWLFLSPFRVLPFPPSLLSSLEGVVQKLGPLTIAAWLDQVGGERAALLPCAWHLICHGRVAVDLDQLLTLSSIVTSYQSHQEEQSHA